MVAEPGYCYYTSLYLGMVFDDRLLARSALQHIDNACSLMERHRRRNSAVPPPADEVVLAFNSRNSDFVIAYPQRGPALPGSASSPYLIQIQILTKF